MSNLKKNTAAENSRCTAAAQFESNNISQVNNTTTVDVPRFIVTIDTQNSFKQKPSSAETGIIRNTLKQPQAVMTLTAPRLANAIRHGYSFQCGVGTWGSNGFVFEQQQLFALDFDNDNEKKPHVNGHEIMERCKELELWPPLLIYSTFRNTETHQRFRVVFWEDEPITDEDEAKEMIEFLHEEFPECDHACSDSTRIFFGSNKGSVIETWGN